MRKRKQDFLLSSVYRNILYYQNMVQRSMNPEQKEYYTNLLNREKLWMDYLREEQGLKVNSRNPMINSVDSDNVGGNTTNEDITAPQMTEPDTDTSVPRTFTVEELAMYNGENGNPPYVAVNGIVYDLSSKIVWRQGNHFGLKAGKDLTAEFQRCHQGILTRLQQLPQVGILIQ
ncbi:putative heme/steroid binding protein [Mobilisporobacter senegalensis]|uniref:Putative heme/steroid binding protein n=1 Tax=Mobilisporobacter senegalensis TaxID=1329262 RepID=A0A3N1XQ58_9FIRM|nr:cytochrome b5 domain-containing protein [Mobilisporobacter senegalensis]ROR27232.1 putative heme/steroid binding protein [Mobilisporobacter senegalensis]